MEPHIVIACPLCAREPVTHCYYEDEVMWIVNCRSCGDPMAVHKKHFTMPPEADRTRIEEVATTLFPDRRVDPMIMSMRDHWHIHMRLKRA